MTIEELERLLAAATPGPWTCEEQSFSRDGEIHITIRTVEKLPEHPWSPRYVFWVNGVIRDYTPPSEWRVCKECGRGHYRNREIAVDVRDDPQTRADASLVVALRNEAPALLAEVRRLREGLVGCAVVLEALRYSVRWELAPEVRAEIVRATDLARRALEGKP